MNNQVDLFRRVTRVYGRAIRHILIALELPRRRNYVRNTIIVDEENSYMPMVDNIIIDTLQDIEVSFDHIQKVQEERHYRIS